MWPGTRKIHPYGPQSKTFIGEYNLVNQSFTLKVHTLKSTRPLAATHSHPRPAICTSVLPYLNVVPSVHTSVGVKGGISLRRSVPNGGYNNLRQSRMRLHARSGGKSDT